MIVLLQLLGCGGAILVIIIILNIVISSPFLSLVLHRALDHGPKNILLIYGKILDELDFLAHLRRSRLSSLRNDEAWLLRELAGWIHTEGARDLISALALEVGFGG